MNSLINEMPGPEVGVKPRAPTQLAPTTIPAAASSSSAWMIQNSFSPVSGSIRNFSQYLVKLSITPVDGVIGYHAPTVAPAYKQPSPVASLPVIMMFPLLSPMVSARAGSGQVKFSWA